MLTGKQVVTRFREMIGDTQATRYEANSPTLLDYLGASLDAAWKDHRHVFYVERVISVKPSNPTRLTDVIQVDDLALERLAHYMAYKSLGEDQEDALNRQLAIDHLNAYMGSV